MPYSVNLSKADVASSNNNIGGFFQIALAMAILYFYPPFFQWSLKPCQTALLFCYKKTFSYDLFFINFEIT